MVSEATAIRRDGRVLGLIGTGHFLSHFYMLCLPPLFPLLKDEFGVGYAGLGLILTITYAASGIAQTPMGFVVDRKGPFVVLTTGLALLAGAMALIAVAPSYWAVLVLAAVAGVGHSVFHPADYAILSAAIDPRRMGRAFSMHTFSGHLGWAAAPATVIFLAALLGWRAALAVLGMVGLAVMLAMLTQRRALTIVLETKQGPPGSGASSTEANDGVRLLTSAPILLFFLFFFVTAMTSSGIRSFAVAAMAALHGTPLTAASTALTGFLVASALGVLIGGLMVDRTRRHDLIAAAALLGTAAAMAVIGTVSLTGAALIALFTVMGLAQGMVRPARDMLVRAVTPGNASGKVFGFVSTGLSVGGAVTPILFGWIIDQGAPQAIFYLLATFMLIAVMAIVAGRRVQVRP